MCFQSFLKNLTVELEPLRSNGGLNKDSEEELDLTAISSESVLEIFGFDLKELSKVGLAPDSVKDDVGET